MPHDTPQHVLARSCQAGPHTTHPAPPQPVPTNSSTPTTRQQQHDANQQQHQYNTTTQPQQHQQHATAARNNIPQGDTPHNVQQRNTTAHRSASHHIASHLLLSLPPYFNLIVPHIRSNLAPPPNVYRRQRMCVAHIGASGRAHRTRCLLMLPKFPKDQPFRLDT